MAATPWWATVLVGVLTVAGAGLGAWIGAKRAARDTRQRELAAAREEWFRRLQWAGGLALEPDDARRLAGLAVLDALARSPLAGPGELDIIEAFNRRKALEEYRRDIAVGDDNEDGPAIGHD